LAFCSGKAPGHISTNDGIHSLV